MRRSPRLLLASLAGLALLLSCVDGNEPIAPKGGASVRVPLAAELVPSPANATAKPINKIRATARTSPEGKVIAEVSLSVDPNAASWQVPIDLPLDGLSAVVIIDIALINVDAAGVESIEFSGQIGPIIVRPGSDSPPLEVPVVRGPLDNLSVTGIDISNATPALVEGASRTLAAAVTTSRTGVNPMVFWSTLDPTLVSLNGAVATALLPGNARVVASAGPASDTATIQILQRPAAVTVSPASQAADLGADVSFTATVLDPRAQPIVGQAVLWRTLDPTILELVTAGRFRALGVGSGRVEARAAADTTLKSVATVRVSRPPADVAVGKTTGTGSANVGDAVGFTVTVSNLSSVQAVGVRVRERLPANLTLEGTTPSGGTFDNATATWSVGNLAAGARATLDVRTRLASGTGGSVVVNTAELIPSDEQTDPNPANNSASAQFSVTEPLGDLQVGKTASRASMNENSDTVTFTVTVKNGDPITVTNLLVVDSMPAGLSILTDAPTRGTYDRTTRLWSIGTLAGGDSARLVIAARANPGTGGTTQTNMARIGSYTGPRDPAPGNDRATASVSVVASNQADVAMTKTVATSPTPRTNDTVTFTVKAKNQGPLAATGVTVKDSLPTGLAFVSATTAVGSFVPTSSTWTIGNLAVGDSAILTLRAIVTGSAGQTLTNTARYLAAGPVPDLNAGNNSATASVVVASAVTGTDVAVTKTVDVASPFELGRVHFTVTASNVGAIPATNLVVKDVLPAGLTVDSTRSATGTIQADTLWTIPTLANGASATFHLYARVNDLTGGTTITNQARRVSMTETDTNAGNDVASSSLTVQRRRVDVQIRKAASVANPAINTAFSYRIVATNRGPGSATGLTVIDTLPSLLTVDSTRATFGSYTPFVWTVGSLAPGDSAVLTVYTKVQAAASGQAISNRAWRAALVQTDSNAVNDSSRVVVNVPVNNRPVVTITAPADNAVFNPGDTVTFTATADDVEDGPLTGAIVWTSNVSGALGTGGTVRRSTLAPGPHLVAATVTDRDGNVAADTVPITIAIVTTPTTLNVPYGSNASLPISLSAPAPAGGLVLTITSADTSKVKVATPTVTIPGGALSANATLTGTFPGTAQVTASTNGYGSSSTSVSVTAALNIVQSSVSFPQGYNSTFTVRLESQGVQIAAPASGISVTLTPTDSKCVAVTSPVTIPAGQVSVTATASYGGSTPVPCNTTVTATATSITSDQFTVFVNTSPVLTVSTTPVGSGLITSSSVSMSYAQHGGITVHLQSLNPSVALVSANSTTPGTAFIDVPLANGSSSFTYYLQGVERTVGNAVIQVTATGVTGDTATVAVQTPVVYLAGLGASYTSLNPDQPIYAQVGTDYFGYSVNVQAIRPGGTPITATFTTSDSTKATLVNSAGTASTRTAQIPVGQYFSPTTVAGGGVAVDFRAAGTTTVSASAPGFTTMPYSSVTVGITAPTIQTYASTLGGGLEIATQAYLGSGGHNGVTVHLVSSDSFAVRLSSAQGTPGTGTLDVPVAAGQTYVNYFIHGMEGAVAQVPSVTAVVRISAPSFVSDSSIVTVVQPNVSLSGLSASHTSLDPDQAFWATVGISDLYYGGVNAQDVRAGGPTLTVTFTSSDTSKARLVNAAGGSGAQLTAQILPGQSNTPTSVATGGLALDLRAAGTTIVQASIPGFVQRPNATVSVSVTAPSITVYQVPVGAGLQTQANAYLGASNHGGVTVHLVSGNPSVALLSPNATTAGTSTLDVVVPNNNTSVGYYVQGVEGTAGTSVVTVSAPGFNTDTASVTVSQPYVALVSVPATTTTLSPNTGFYAAVGLSDLYYGGVNGQPIRAGGSPLTVTLQSSNQGVGQIRTAAGTSGSGTVTIPVGLYYSPTSFAGGGSEFDPVGAGTTVVSGAITGYLQRPNANTTVTVSSPGITVSTLTVGGGLMTQGSVSLGASGHGGVTVRIRSSSGSIAKVSANSTTAGADSVDIPVAAGGTSLSYWVHGQDGQTGTVTITASAPGFTDGTATTTVVQAGLQIVSLGTSYSAAGANVNFAAYVGYPSGGGVAGQPRRAGAPDLVATITSSQPAAGTLVTSAGSAASRTVNIAAGQQQSPNGLAAGGIQFDPVAQGSTSVTATIPGLVSTTAATVNVTVGP